MTLSERNQKRIRNSIEGRKSDRQPFMFFINYPFIHSVTGVPLHEYFNDPKTMLDAQVETFRKLGLNGPVMPDYGVVAECSGMGAHIQYDKLGFPSVHNPQNLELEEVVKIKPGDPWAGNLMTKALEALQYMKGNAPEGFIVENSIMVGPFTTAAMLRGISDFCADLYEEPDMIKALIDTVVETEIRFMKEQEKILGKLDHILLADDITSFVSEGQFREFVMPAYDKLYSAFPGVERWLHNDGEAGRLAGLIADCGFKLWHVGTCFDIVQARKDSRGEVSLVGNLSPLTDLRQGTAESVWEAANRQMDLFEGDSKFILGTGGYINYGTPPENLIAVIKAAEERRQM